MAVTSMSQSSIRDFNKFNNASGFLGSIGDTVQWLVIAGGGGGGCGRAGGGGAGGYQAGVPGEVSGRGEPGGNPQPIAVSDSFTVTVGAGGTGSSAFNLRGTSGGNSEWGLVTVIGGGAGGSFDNSVATGLSGGSGGGHGQTTASPGPSGTRHEGQAGGLGTTTRPQPGGAGGGALTVGGNARTSIGGGIGGTGITSSITGTAVGRAGGGGGGGGTSSTLAGTATDGGGAGGSSSSNGVAGTVNTGGGGGGGGDNGSTTFSGGNGGAGIVVLKYPQKFSLTVGVGLTSSTSTVGNFKVTTFTAGTGTVTVA